MDNDAGSRARINLLTGQPFVKAAMDPDLIPGVYLLCDQWCMYCPVTRRCLAYTCQPSNPTEESTRDIYENIAERMYESLTLVKHLTAAEGRTIPELEARFPGARRFVRPGLDAAPDSGGNS